MTPREKLARVMYPNAFKEQTIERLADMLGGAAADDTREYANAIRKRAFNCADRLIARFPDIEKIVERE